MKKLFWIIPLLSLLLLTSAFIIWAVTPSGPEHSALQALEGDAGVLVEQDGWITFTPTEGKAEIGFIFYPGGHVDPRSYAPIAAEISREGCQVVILKPPLNLAVFNPLAAAEVIRTYPQIKTWTVGGHSLGGTMAARYVYEDPENVEGLVLWASYPAPGNDLSDSDLFVTSIYATRDGLTTQDEIQASRSLLPENTSWVAIEGGNHAQFGAYGPQSGDLEATIDAEVQQDQAVQATLTQLRCRE